MIAFRKLNCFCLFRQPPSTWLLLPCRSSSLPRPLTPIKWCEHVCRIKITPTKAHGIASSRLGGTKEWRDFIKVSCLISSTSHPTFAWWCWSTKSLRAKFFSQNSLKNKHSSQVIKRRENFYFHTQTFEDNVKKHQKTLTKYQNYFIFNDSKKRFIIIIFIIILITIPLQLLRKSVEKKFVKQVKCDWEFCKFRLKQKHFDTFSTIFLFPFPFLLHAHLSFIVFSNN